VFSYNLVFGNTVGVAINSGAADNVIGNRIFDTAGYGLSLSTSNANVSQNTIYSNALAFRSPAAPATCSPTI